MNPFYTRFVSRRRSKNPVGYYTKAFQVYTCLRDNVSRLVHVRVDHALHIRVVSILQATGFSGTPKFYGLVCQHPPFAEPSVAIYIYVRFERV